MHKSLRYLLLTSAAVLLATAPAATASERGGTRPGAQGVVVVSYDSPEALERALARTPGRVVRRIPQLRVVAIRPDSKVQTFVARMRASRGIGFAERVKRRVDLSEPALVPAPVPGGAYEWQFAATRADQVPASVLRAAGAIRIAVLDTGGDLAAPDLATNVVGTRNVIANSSDVTDLQGHGTFVSSLAAGSATNNEGVAGFGGDAKLLIVKMAHDDGSLTDIDAAAGIVYAVDHGAKIINMSFGGTSSSAAERSALAYAAAHGALCVAAAGNEALDGNPPEYPAADLQPIGSNGQGGTGLSVGATDLNGERAAFSNTGSYISLAAPGEDVFGAVASTSGWTRTPLPGSLAGFYGYASGTSFASPETAGAAALVWAANPALSAQEVAAILKETASGEGAWSPELGYGLIDVAAAVARAQGVTAGSRAAKLSGTQSGAHVHLTWSARGAVSYRLSVAKDAGPAHVLLASTTATSADYNLVPGHEYAFTVAATDPYGYVASSAPFTVSLPQAKTSLRLTASRKVGRSPLRLRFAATLTASQRGISTAGRRLVLESFDGSAWRRFASATTGPRGGVTWKVRLRRGTYRVRAHFAGTAELAASASASVGVRVRRR